MARLADSSLFLSLSIAATVAWTGACGVDDSAPAVDAIDDNDDNDDIDDIDDNDDNDIDDNDGVAISAIDVDVSPCLCRCTTDENTTLTVHGAGFVNDEHAVTTVFVDDVVASAGVSDQTTLSVFLWASPAAGTHTLTVWVVDRAGAEHGASSTFVMPE